MEVEQSLGVLDGGIVVLDGSAGVEAQTITVWRQSNYYKLPKIVYVNKMDRADGNFLECLQSIEEKLEAVTLPLHHPIRDDNRILVGIADLVTMERLTFSKNDQGMKMTRNKLSETTDGQLWEDCQERRRTLVDRLTELDDTIADLVIEQESLEQIQASHLSNALRKCTILGKAVPVLLGSSYKNIGVQPLMDAVVLYLPSPMEARQNRYFRHFNGELAAKAFKVVHDKQRGPLTFFRIYSGELGKNSRVHNVTQNAKEQGTRLYVAYADDYEEIGKIGTGNIATLAGLKSVKSGDLIVGSAAGAERAKKSMLEDVTLNKAEVERIFTVGANIPDPVFFCSIEPPSLSYQRALETALEELEREDPSLRVTYNEETGQTVLGGMGELHIEIIKVKKNKNELTMFQVYLNTTTI